jgi:hypothetical protein
LKLTQLGIDVDRATCVDNLRRILEPASKCDFFVRIDMENSPYTQRTLEIFETLWEQGEEGRRPRAVHHAGATADRRRHVPCDRDPRSRSDRRRVQVREAAAYSIRSVRVPVPLWDTPGLTVIAGEGRA